MKNPKGLHALALAESEIDGEFRGYIEVGNALSEIREKVLYKKKGYSSFGNYTRERWGMTEREARDAIEIAKIVGLPLGQSNLEAGIFGRGRA